MSVDQDALYESRLELVDFLTDVYADYPSVDLLERLLEGEFTIPQEGVSDELDAGFEALERFVDENEGRSAETVREELETEYTRLFVGPRPPVMCHETYYRDDTEFRGSGLTKVEASYGAAGWSPPESYPEENDHVAVELAFLRYLVRRQRNGDEEAFGFQRVFHDEHLSRWIGDCATDTVEEAEEPLYEAAGYLLAGYVGFEEELVNQMT